MIRVTLPALSRAKLIWPGTPISTTLAGENTPAFPAAGAWVEDAGVNVVTFPSRSVSSTFVDDPDPETAALIPAAAVSSLPGNHAPVSRVATLRAVYVPLLEEGGSNTIASPSPPTNTSEPSSRVLSISVAPANPASDPSRFATHPGPNTPWAAVAGSPYVAWERDRDICPVYPGTDTSVTVVLNSPVNNATWPGPASATGNPSPKACGTRNTDRASASPVHFVAPPPYVKQTCTSSTTGTRSSAPVLVFTAAAAVFQFPVATDCPSF